MRGGLRRPSIGSCAMPARLFPNWHTPPSPALTLSIAAYGERSRWARDSGMISKAQIRHVVVLGHPAAGSFNHQVAETYCQAVRACGQVALLRDLYASGFDPLLKADERLGHGTGAFAADVADELD